MGPMSADGGINRRKKTPEELAAEAAAADQDEFTSKCVPRCVYFLQNFQKNISLRKFQKM